MSHLTEFKFFGPPNPPLDDLAEISTQSLSAETPTLATILFIHLPVPPTRLFARSLELAATIDEAFAQRGYEQPDLVDLIQRMLANDDNQYEMTLAEVTVANAFAGFGTESTPPRLPPELCLTHAIDYLAQYLTALSAATDKIVCPPVTGETLPRLIPYFNKPTDGSPETPSLLKLHDHEVAFRPSEEVPSDTLGRVEGLISLERVGHPFATADRTFVHSQAIRLYQGDRKSAVVLAAAAAEVMLDALLASLLWEERVDPRAAAEKFENTSLAPRVKKEYHNRIGGAWDIHDRSSPVGVWQTRVASVRHRVVHAGYDPDPSEVDEALEAVQELRNFLRDRLSRPSVIATYPNSVLLIMGEPELRNRGLWVSAFDHALHQVENNLMMERFGTWKRFVDLYRRGVDMEGEPEDWSNCRLVLRYDPEGNWDWWVHDEERLVVAPAEEPEDVEPEVIDSIQEFISGTEQSGSVGMARRSGTPRAGTTWSPNFEIFPDMNLWPQNAGED